MKRKPLFRNASLFVGGFLLMAMAHLMTRCEDYGGVMDYGEGPLITNSKAVEKAGNSIEEAFLSGKPAKVKELISTASLSIYGEWVENSSAVSLQAFGEAFQNREIGVMAEKYAEFTFTADGVEYTVALSMDDDGNWKIMRL